MLNEKMLYQKAEAEVICFDNTDVITASGGSCGTGNLCCDLCIADQLCECMGGDLCSCM